MSDWREDLEEKIRLEVNEAVQAWRKDAYLNITDFDEGQPLMVEMRIPDYDDGFLDPDVVKPRSSLADLLRDYIHTTGTFWHDSDRSDEAYLSATIPTHHPTEQRKLKLGQDLLRLVLAYDAERANDEE
jgi:hypothetical protein